LARSNPRRPAPVPDAPRPAAAGAEPARPPSLAAATLPRVWQGVGYRPLADPGLARPLFDYAAVPWPPVAPAVAWGAFTAAGGDERLVAALVGERAERAMMLHGPVVVEGETPLEIAAQLVAAVLDHAAALGVETVYARPQGLDRVWVRFGFVPVPESTLPAALAGRPGVGLYGWRGGTALWTFREPAEDV